MELIGKGWQYTVYDLGNGRVLKKCNSTIGAFFIMLYDSFPYIHHPIWDMPRLRQEAKKAVYSSISNIKYVKLEAWMLANPIIHEDFSYEQDLVMPLSTYLNHSSEVEGKTIIDDFANFSVMLVKHSCIDKRFDIGNNFGIDALGRIVLIDLGELCCDIESVHSQIQLRAWKSHSVLSGVPRRFRTYFIKAMDEKFNEIPT